jgi:hypothetical protein
MGIHSSVIYMGTFLAFFDQHTHASMAIEAAVKAKDAGLGRLA